MNFPASAGSPPQRKKWAPKYDSGSDEDKDIPVLDNDKDSDGTFPDSITNFTQPENGVVEVNPDGTVDYRPNTDFVGRDCFTYENGIRTMSAARRRSAS